MTSPLLNAMDISQPSILLTHQQHLIQLLLLLTWYTVLSPLATRTTNSRQKLNLHYLQSPLCLWMTSSSFQFLRPTTEAILWLLFLSHLIFKLSGNLVSSALTKYIEYYHFLLPPGLSRLYRWPRSSQKHPYLPPYFYPFLLSSASSQQKNVLVKI